MGQSEFTEVKLVDTLDMAPAAAEPDLAAAFANRTEMKLAEQLVDQGRANRRLQQSLAKPDVEGLGGYKRTSGFDTLIAGAQVPLPFSNRNQGNIAAADAEIRVAESELAATRAMVAAEVKAAIADVRSRERQLRELFPAILQQARESASIAQAAYREGGLDLLRLVDAERVRIDTEVLYYRTLAEYRQSLAALEAALGVM
jgi:outer membrane protein TolC